LPKTSSHKYCITVSTLLSGWVRTLSKPNAYLAACPSHYRAFPWTPSLVWESFCLTWTCISALANHTHFHLPHGFIQSRRSVFDQWVCHKLLSYSELRLNCHYSVFPFEGPNHRGLLSWYLSDSYLLIHVMKYVSLCYADLYSSSECNVCSTSYATFTHYLGTSSFGIIIDSAVSTTFSILAGSSG
jgi:hypothetical protein